jgi:hypothetical protein
VAGLAEPLFHGRGRLLPNPINPRQRLGGRLRQLIQRTQLIQQQPRHHIPHKTNPQRRQETGGGLLFTRFDACQQVIHLFILKPFQRQQSLPFFV